MIMKYKWTLIGTVIALLAAITGVLALNPESLLSNETSTVFETRMRNAQLLRVGVIVVIWGLFWNPISRIIASKTTIPATKIAAMRWRFLGWYMVFEMLFGLGVIG